MPAGNPGAYDDPTSPHYVSPNGNGTGPEAYKKDKLSRRRGKIPPSDKAKRMKMAAKHRMKKVMPVKKVS